jgi:hypothetical protein
MARLTFGKSRVRESRMLGSVKAKPTGLATRPRSGSGKNHKLFERSWIYFGGNDDLENPASAIVGFRNFCLVKP